MSDALVPSELGSFRLIEELGRGGMGRVYLAEGEAGRVAIKVLRPELVERPGLLARFQREAEAGEQVRHPNVVRTLGFDFQMTGDIPLCFLVMGAAVLHGDAVSTERRDSRQNRLGFNGRHR